jgi:tetratricopeptide (TPR) repeat protein
MDEIAIEHAMRLAVESHRAGRLDEAEAMYRRVAEHNPKRPNVLHMLGVIAFQRGRFAEAAGMIREAIRLQPESAEAHFNLANALAKMESNDEASVAFRRAIEIRPGYAEAWNNLGNLLRETNKLDESQAALTQATRLKPNFAEAHNNLGNVLRDKGLMNDAIAAHAEALRLRPEYAEAANNFGNALGDIGRYDEAIAYLQSSLRLQPDLAEAHFNLANLLLLKGDYVHGWAEYEWRMRCKVPKSKPRKFARPRWDGTPLNGRTIFLHAEQGFGDSIQFVRYVHSISARGGKIIFECAPELVRLFKMIPGVEQVIAPNTPPPHFDVHCPMFSLPTVLRTTLETVPSAIPYLTVEDSLKSEWKARLAPFAGRQVGLVWAGNSSQRNDYKRSFPLFELAPLAHVAGITFHSLQKGPPAQQASSPPAGMELIDHSAELTDFAETAALISNLDLVIAADTATAHLAGALAKPTWIPLTLLHDWRWLLDRVDSPWYPTVRLFRQQNLRDWPPVIERIAKTLETWRAEPLRK